MDLRTVFSTFVAVFLAELGDKTQLITFGASASSDSKWSVFIGSATALVVASALGVLAGGLVGHLISEKILERAAGISLVGLGLFTIWKSF